MIARSKFPGRGISAHTPREEFQCKKRHRQTATEILNIKKLFFLDKDRVQQISFELSSNMELNCRLLVHIRFDLERYLLKCT